MSKSSFCSSLNMEGNTLNHGKFLRIVFPLVAYLTGLWRCEGWDVGCGVALADVLLAVSDGQTPFSGEHVQSVALDLGDVSAGAI